ncbi:hypothetical protein [Nocardioides sp. B-3]|uniref:hypothetical protein n=1 Tax=Nocardioides sp. B-3 TaxID=2895565 RepID=UPI002152702A|nr:hypothetical protein [Nocardioides sp. B-3]UUZ58654.1 hypothetical protein LP418_21415 [Nocardioides sp. B-3]
MIASCCSGRLLAEHVEVPANLEVGHVAVTVRPGWFVEFATIAVHERDLGALGSRHHIANAIPIAEVLRLVESLVTTLQRDPLDLGRLVQSRREQFYPCLIDRGNVEEDIDVDRRHLLQDAAAKRAHHAGHGEANRRLDWRRPPGHPIRDEERGSEADRYRRHLGALVLAGLGILQSHEGVDE